MIRFSVRMNSRTIGAADQPVDLALVRDGTCPELGHHGLARRRERERIRPSIAGEAFADDVVQPAQVIEDRGQARRVAANGGRKVALCQAGIGIDQEENRKAPRAAVDTVGPAGEGLERHLLRQPQMKPDRPAEPTEVDFPRLGWLVLRHSLEPLGGTAGHRSSLGLRLAWSRSARPGLAGYGPLVGSQTIWGQTNRQPQAGAR